MAAVIRYLSADNHTADTPPFNGPETGLYRAIMSLFCRPIFEMHVCQRPVDVCVPTERSLRMCLSVHVQLFQMD